MHLIPTNEEVIALLRKTAHSRDGHFEYPNGVHTNEYLQWRWPSLFSECEDIERWPVPAIRADVELQGDD